MKVFVKIVVESEKYPSNTIQISGLIFPIDALLSNVVKKELPYRRKILIT